MKLEVGKTGIVQTETGKFEIVKWFLGLRYHFIVKIHDGKYMNYYDYARTIEDCTRAYFFDTLDEAEKMLKKHRPYSKKIPAWRLL